MPILIGNIFGSLKAQQDHLLSLWFAARVATRELLFARGIGDTDTCQVCQQHTESILHVLRDCAFWSNFTLLLSIPHGFTAIFTKNGVGLAGIKRGSTSLGRLSIHFGIEETT